jgi:hypothetical protein
MNIKYILLKYENGGKFSKKLNLKIKALIKFISSLPKKLYIGYG